MNRMHLLAASALACLTMIGAARADIILSMNDNHTVFDDNANQVAPDTQRPDSIDINAARTRAALSNMGRGDGDRDSVSLIDLTTKPMLTVETVGVTSGPEPLKFSPTMPVQNAREKMISVFRFDGHKLTPGADLKPTGEPVAFGAAWP